jgi:hypothetical protein
MNLQFVAREVSDRLTNNVAENLDAYRSGKTAGLIKTSDCRISRIIAGDAPELLAENGECLRCLPRFTWPFAVAPKALGVRGEERNSSDAPEVF